MHFYVFNFCMGREDPKAEVRWAVSSRKVCWGRRLHGDKRSRAGFEGSSWLREDTCDLGALEWRRKAKRRWVQDEKLQLGEARVCTIRNYCV